MLDIAERVAEKVRQLPSSRQQQVLNFVESLQLYYDNSEITDKEWLSMAARNPAFAFLYDEEEDIYTLEDGEPYIPSSQDVIICLGRIA
jgi:hypothetical protein